MLDSKAFKFAAWAVVCLLGTIWVSCSADAEAFATEWGHGTVILLGYSSPTIW
jgi:hypothetical protein